MRASVHGRTEMWSAECGVQTFHDFSAHATGFSQWGTRGMGQETWDLTDLSERRILSAFGRANLPVSPI
jgi:hypothetical protein